MNWTNENYWRALGKNLDGGTNHRSDPNNQAVIGRQFKVRRRFNYVDDRQQLHRDRDSGILSGVTSVAGRLGTSGHVLPGDGTVEIRRGGFDGGTVGIPRELRLGKRRLETCVRGTGGRRGEPWGAAVEGLGSVRRREARLELEGWNVRGNDCGKNDKGRQNTRLRLLEKRKIIISI